MKKRSWLAYPYLVWMVLFIVIPLLLIVFFSLTDHNEAGLVFTLKHISRFMEPIYLLVFWRSIKIALISTLVCFLLGYPMALILAQIKNGQRNILVLLFVMPMWMNFLLRTYVWMSLLEKNGIINKLLGFFNLPTLNLLYNDLAVILGMVYNFLPFMVLPIYSVLSKTDQRLIEAAQDLGANSLTVFRKVIFPLSLPGVMSGNTMVFMSALTTFVIPRLLGGGQYTLIGNLIEQQFIFVGDWGFGSALSLIMMLVILLSMKFVYRYEKEQEGRGLF